jgi:hypothetical protein
MRVYLRKFKYLTLNFSKTSQLPATAVLRNVNLKQILKLTSILVSAHALVQSEKFLDTFFTVSHVCIIFHCLESYEESNNPVV